jgi:FkbM family methyltransferase
MLKMLVRRLVSETTASAKVMEYDANIWLKRSYSFATLLDIGANDGEHGAFLARYFGMRRAYFFEPQAQYAARLRAVARGIPDAEVFEVALGDAEGSAELHAMAHAASSSLLPPDKGALAEFPQHKVHEQVRVPVRTLDSLLSGRRLEDDVFIKMDVQGFEDRVIRGGREVFQRARVVLVEMSFVPLFAGQSLFEEVHALLVQCGMHFAGIKNQVMMPATLRPAFAHCFYLRD